jgi:hypothetical protein
MRSIEYMQSRGAILVASAALALSATEAQAAPNPIENNNAIAAHTYSAPEQAKKPVNQDLPLKLRGDEDSNCTAGKAVSLSLRGPRTIVGDGSVNPHRLIVQACKKSARNKPYIIKYKNQDNPPVIIKTRLNKANKIAIPVRVNPVAFDEDYKPPVLKASVYKTKSPNNQKLITHNGWLTTYRGTRKPALTGTLGENCKPDHGYENGIQDDNEFVYEESGIPRSYLLQFGWRELGARVLRMNVIDGDAVDERTYKPLVETAQTAKALGYKVLMTIMQRPVYLPYIHDTFSASNFTPEAAVAHTNRAMYYMGQYADYIEEGNEPNHTYYNLNSGDVHSYISVQQAMTNAIISSPYKEPDAKILAGSMAPSYIDTINWLPQINNLQADGFSAHGYWMTGRIPEIVGVSKKPVYVTEQGSGVTPRQAEDNRINNAIVKCAGAKMSIQYQIIQRGKSWDTAPFSLAYVREKIAQMR